MKTHIFRGFSHFCELNPFILLCLNGLCWSSLIELSRGVERFHILLAFKPNVKKTPPPAPPLPSPPSPHLQPQKIILVQYCSLLPILANFESSCKFYKLFLVCISPYI